MQLRPGPEALDEQTEPQKSPCPTQRPANKIHVRSLRKDECIITWAAQNNNQGTSGTDIQAARVTQLQPLQNISWIQYTHALFIFCRSSPLSFNPVYYLQFYNSTILQFYNYYYLMLSSSLPQSVMTCHCRHLGAFVSQFPGLFPLHSGFPILLSWFGLFVLPGLVGWLVGCMLDWYGWRHWGYWVYLDVMLADECAYLFILFYSILFYSSPPFLLGIFGALGFCFVGEWVMSMSMFVVSFRFVLAIRPSM